MIAKGVLERLYFLEGKSMQEIANHLSCSVHAVKYWMDKHELKIRSISDAVYLKNNPNGDPFTFKKPTTIEEAKLFGLGIGLYWGEGTKADHGSVRLGNSDAALVGKFIDFLVKFFCIRKEELRFSLQLFYDSDIKKALAFWCESLGVVKKQFYKTTVTPSVSKGTYRKKAEHGVITVYYHNTKLKKLVSNLLPT